MLDNQADFYSYQGREQEANIFASNLLLPDELLNRLDVSELRFLAFNTVLTYLLPNIFTGSLWRYFRGMGGFCDIGCCN
jgi:hypothetical protein